MLSDYFNLFDQKNEGDYYLPLGSVIEINNFTIDVIPKGFIKNNKTINR